MGLKYSFDDMQHDIISALTVAMVALPQAMAYAVIAGVGPVYGLYASILPVLIGSLLGSSRFLIGGPTNSVSMLLYTTLVQITIGGVTLINLPQEERLFFVFALSFISGIIQIGIGASKLGKFATFLSYPVLVAYTVGCALLIGVGQLKNFFGLSFPTPPTSLGILREVFLHIEEAQLWAMSIALGTIFLTLIFQRLKKTLPAHLMSIICFTFLGYFSGLREKGVLMADFVSAYLPPLSNPLPTVFSYFDVLFMPALAIAIISSIDSIANGRSFANKKGDRFDVNRELMAQGISKVVGGFSSSIPGSGSFSRSAINYVAGGRTRFAGVFSALFSLLAILFFGPFIGYIPISSLAGLLILIAFNMIKKKDILFVWNSTKQDKLVFGITLLAILLLSLDNALIVGVLLSLGLFLNSEAQLRIEKIRRSRVHSYASEWVFNEQNDVLLYTLEGAFFFGATSVFEDTFYKENIGKAKVIILHLTRVHFLDASGAKSIKILMKKLRRKQSKLILSGANKEVKAVIKASGLNIGPKGCYLAGNIDGAIELAEYLLICGQTDEDE